MKNDKELKALNAEFAAQNDQVNEEDLTKAAGGFTPIPLRDDITPVPLRNDFIPIPLRDDTTPVPLRDDTTPIPLRDDIVPGGLPDGIVITDTAPLPHGNITHRPLLLR